MVLILCFTPFWLMKGVIGMLSFRQRGKPVSLDVIHNGLFFRRDRPSHFHRSCFSDFPFSVPSKLSKCSLLIQALFSCSHL